MSDEIDIANARAEADTARLMAHRRQLAQQIPPGAPGECELCGEWSGRLVGGACAPCRDRHGLP
jgi:hypothetical protein